MRISDWSSDVCFFRSGSDIRRCGAQIDGGGRRHRRRPGIFDPAHAAGLSRARSQALPAPGLPAWPDAGDGCAGQGRSEEHTSELQSLMRISYAVFCLKKKKTNTTDESYVINTNP